MNIEKLEIRGFGKFNNLTLNLMKGLNVFFGNNETGKTTIQIFIKAMLYGMKGGRTGKDGLLPPLKRYKPWNGKEYSGFIQYCLDNNEVYRVGRNFENNAVRVFDSLFNDITGAFPASRERGALFAEKHLGINEACFDRTVFIKQMETRVDNDESKGLVNRIINVSQTGYEDVSLKAAQEALKDALKQFVGNEKTYTRPLDKVNTRLEELKRQKDKLVEKRNSMLIVENDLKDLIKDKNKFERKKACLENIKIVLEAREQAESINGQYKNLLGLIDYQKRLQVEIAEKENMLREIEFKLEPLKGFANLDDGIEDRVLEFKKTLDNLRAERERNSLESIIFKIQNTSQKYRKYNLGLGIFTGIFMVTLAAGVKWFSQAIITASIECLPILVLFLRQRKVNKELCSLKNEKKLIFIQENHIAEEIKSLEKQLEDILKTVNADGIEDFFRLKGAYDLASNKLETVNGKFECSERDYTDCIKRIKEVLDFLESRLSDMGLIQEKSFDSNMPEGLSGILGKIDLCIRGLHLGLAGDVDKLPVSCHEMGYNKERLLNSNIEQLDTAIDDDYTGITEEINNVLLKIKEFETILKTTSVDSDELQKNDEEMEILESKKAQLQDIDFSLRTALEVMHEAGLEIQRDFAPALNTRISEIINKITCKRYRDVRVDDNLSIKAVVPETQDIVTVSMLSGGTVDQTYLALRLGMAELISTQGEKLPVIMDEIFAQYDDARTKETFEYFKNQLFERQIILFTCKSREIDIAREVFGDSLNIAYL